jgi:hypothetical protein
LADLRDLQMDEIRSGESAADLALELVGYNKEVLGVGRVSAAMTESLMQQGCTVSMLERFVPPDWRSSTGTDEQPDVSDLDDDVAWLEAKDESFDVVLVADELVRARDPLAVLGRATRKLKPAGVLVAWLPNVAHGDTRIALEQGNFRYGGHGSLDVSQLESFTLVTIRDLFRRSGLVIVDTARVIVPLFGQQFGVIRDEAQPKSLHDLLDEPEIETYEFVVRAVRDNGDRALADLAQRFHELADRVHGESARSALLRIELRQMEYVSWELQRHQEHVQDQQRAIAEQQRYIEALTGHISGLEHNVEVLTRSLEELHQSYVAVQATYKEILGRRTVRGTAPIRRAYDKLTRRPEVR